VATVFQKHGGAGGIENIGVIQQVALLAVSVSVQGVKRDIVQWTMGNDAQQAPATKMFGDRFDQEPVEFGQGPGPVQLAIAVGWDVGQDLAFGGKGAA